LGSAQSEEESKQLLKAIEVEKEILKAEQHALRHGLR